MAPARHPSLLGGGTGKRPQATPSSRLCFECFECAALIFLNLSPDFRDEGDPTLRAEMSLLLGPAVGPPATRPYCFCSCMGRGMWGAGSLASLSHRVKISLFVAQRGINIQTPLENESRKDLVSPRVHRSLPPMSLGRLTHSSSQEDSGLRALEGLRVAFLTSFWVTLELLVGSQRVPGAGIYQAFIIAQGRAGASLVVAAVSLVLMEIKIRGSPGGPNIPLR